MTQKGTTTTTTTTTTERRVGTFVPPEVVFPELTATVADLKALLSQLPMIDVLLWASQLNVVVSTTGIKQNHILQQQFGLNIFFSFEEIERINAYTKEHGGAENVHVFVRAPLLELIRWACFYCPKEREDGRKFDDPEIRRIFAKALLVASSLWSKRVYKTKFGTVNADGTTNSDDKKSRRYSALQSVRNSISQTASAPVFYRAIAQARALFLQHMPAFYPEFGDVFEQATGLSLQEYFDCWVSQVTQFLPHEVKLTDQHVSIERNCWWHHTAFCQNIPSKEPFFRRLLELESQTVDELKAALRKDFSESDEGTLGPFSLNCFRQKPILKLDEDLYVLIDPVFCLDKLSVGPLFHTLRRPDLLRATREPFESFGHAFESYCNQMLDRMFNGQTSSLAKRLIPNLHHRISKREQPEILDALLIDAECAVFFQIKARWLREDVISSDDPQAFQEHLMKKYGDGLDQLVEAITMVGTGEWSLADEGSNTWKTVYPMLLVHDRLLDAPIQQAFLVDKFEEKLKPDEVLASGYYRKGRFIVPPLIVITGDTIEDLESSLRHFSFTDLLRDYCLSCGDRLKTLREFFQTSRYAKISYGNRRAAQDNIDAFDSVISNLFQEPTD